MCVIRKINVYISACYIFYQILFPQVLINIPRANLASAEILDSIHAIEENFCKKAICTYRYSYLIKNLRPFGRIPPRVEVDQPTIVLKRGRWSMSLSVPTCLSLYLEMCAITSRYVPARSASVLVSSGRLAQVNDPRRQQEFARHWTEPDHGAESTRPSRRARVKAEVKASVPGALIESPRERDGSGRGRQNALEVHILSKGVISLYMHLTILRRLIHFFYYL